MLQSGNRPLTSDIFSKKQNKNKTKQNKSPERNQTKPRQVIEITRTKGISLQYTRFDQEKGKKESFH